MYTDRTSGDVSVHISSKNVTQQYRGLWWWPVSCNIFFILLFSIFYFFYFLKIDFKGGSRHDPP
jgi:hypothetical protein